MKKTGIIIDNLTKSQINLDIQLNFKSGFIFVKELIKNSLRTNLVVMDISEIWGFDDGVLIATSIDTALFMQKAVCNSEKIFYIQDYEEIKRRTDPKNVMNLMTDKNIKFAVRSQYISKLLEKQFNTRAHYIWENIGEYICTKK